MNKYIVALLGGLVIVAGSAACYFSHRATKAEKELAELQAAFSSTVSCPMMPGKPQNPDKISAPASSNAVASVAGNVQTSSGIGGVANLPGVQLAKSVTNMPKVEMAGAAHSKSNVVEKATGMSLPFEVESIDYDGGDLRIGFINSGKGPISAPTNSALGISPPTETSFRVVPDGVVVSGNFKPDTLYTAVLSKDWSTADGRTLGRETRVSVRTPKLEPVFNMLARGQYYPARSSGALRFPFESRFVTNLEVTVYRAFENNLNYYDPGSWEANTRMAEIAKGRVELAPPYNDTANRMLEIDNLITNRVPGVYRVKVASDALRRYWWGGRGSPITETVNFALTDLGISCSFDERNGRRAFVSVSRLSCGRPVVGATVTILSRKNRIVSTGTTREDGSLLMDFDPVYDNEHDSVKGVLAKSGDDYCYLQLDDESEQFDNSSDGDFARPRAFIFAERDLCRPGETFESAVFARAAAKTGASAFAGAALDLVFIDREGTEVGTRRVTTDRYGYASAKWSIPADAAAGNWRVVCRLGEHELGDMHMRVASFTPDRFRVKLETDKTAWAGLDRPVAFTGSARYYFGENVDEADWKFSAELYPAPAPKHWKGWTAGAPGAIEGKKFTEQGEVVDGKFNVTYPSVATQGVEQTFAPVLIAAEASVTEPGGRSVTAVQRLTVFPTDRFIGVRNAEVKPGETRAFELCLLTATPDTVVVNETDTEMALSFEKSEWDYHYVRKNSAYSTEWREVKKPMPKLSRKVHLPIGASAATWRARVAFAARDMPSGHYVLTVERGMKLKTVYDFWHWQGEVNERSASPAALDLRAGAESYHPGDTAELTFNVPYSGRAYLVAGAGTVEHASSMPVTVGANTMRLAIPASCAAGSYYAAVTFITENSPKMRRLSGLARIKLDNDDNHQLVVGCRLPKLGRPSSDAEVEVTLSDRAGRPRAGRVRLVACDVGVLALTGYATPDPYDFFFKRDFGCPFAVHDLYNLVYPELKLLPNGQIGGGADTAMISFNRRDSNAKQKETARVVVPPLDIPASGKAKVRVRLPDHTGSLRFMAVAANERSVGCADDELIMRSPATVMLASPRFACAGDRFTITAQLFNHDLGGEEWTLRVKLPEGLVMGGEHEFTRRGCLVKGCSETVRFEVAAAEAASGAGRISAELEIGGEKISDETFVTVHPRRPVETRVEYFVSTNGMPSLVPVENDWLKAERKVETSLSPAFAVKESLGWLNSYPYGCLEQTCAAAFPFLAADDLKALGLISEVEFGMARQRVEAAYAHVMQMRLEDGGFSMWPRGDSVWVEGSVFACHFLLEAERKGLLKLDGTRRGELLDYLATVTEGMKMGNAENRAYASYALAVAGDERFLNPARNLCRPERPDWPTFLAASALIRGGYASEGLEGYNAAVAARAWSRDSSRMQRLGMALFITSHSGLAEDFSAMMSVVEELNRHLRGDGSAWGTTQDNAWASAGLASFLNGASLGGDVKFIRVITTGIPRKPFLKPNPVKISRRYLDSNGRATLRARRGDLVTVELTISTPDTIGRAVICDLLPSGLELEDDTFLTRSRAKTGAGDSTEFVVPEGRPELRDDRWLWFGRLLKLPAGKVHRILYRVRAVTSGTFTVPSVMVEDMYDPDLRGSAEGEGAFVVE